MTDLGFGMLVGSGFNALESLKVAGDAQARAAQMRQAQAEQARQAQVAQLSGAALNGDPQAKAQLAYLDRDFFQSLDKSGAEKAKADIEELGQIALLADTPEKWDAYAREYAQRGHPEAMQYVGKFSAPLRATIIARAGEAKALLDQQKVDYRVIPQGGYLQAFNGATGAPIGDVQTQPQPTAGGAPQSGAIEDGHRFMGGNPADPSNWQPVGGAASQGAGTFR